MKESIMQKLGVVWNALDNVEVKGERNLANLSGSMTLLKEIMNDLNNAEVAPRVEDKHD